MLNILNAVLSNNINCGNPKALPKHKEWLLIIHQLKRIFAKNLISKAQ
jgi:hypothetical protein